MTDTILCIDIGTTSLKAAFMKDKPEPVFVSRQKFSSGMAEEWLPALKKALSELREKCPECAVEAICISGNGPTLVMEEGGAGLQPSLCPPFANAHCPPAANNCGATSAHPITLLHNAEIPQDISIPQTKSIFIPRLKAFKEMYPSIWESAENVFSGPEYFIYQLTGSKLTILPEERFTPAYWTNEELLRCGFTESDIKKLPPFVKASGFAGKVTAEAAIATGLFEGTFVFCGGPDFSVALVGTGTVFPGKLCYRAGSTEGLNLCTSQPVFAEGLRTLPSMGSESWNLGKLLQNGENFSKAMEQLKTAANNAGEYLPPEMTITGGKALDSHFIAEKEKQSGVKIKTLYCHDAELIGDLILARVGLMDYDDIMEACFAMGLY